MSGNDSTRIVWAPQPGPQKALIDCPVPEIFYGGARGGGKTDGVLGKYALKAERYGAAFNALFFRRELPMLDDAIERSKQIFGPLGAVYREDKSTWRFPGGGRLRFRPLERLSDAEKYQGQNVSDVAVEEIGNYPDPGPIDRLHGILRSAAGVPTQMLLTGNPGGPGQLWIKARYVDPAPGGMKVLTRDLPNGEQHKYVFIPSKLQQNRALMMNDPGYVNRLYLVGSKELVKAWLDGDWSAISGAYFEEFSMARHVVRPIDLPKHWARFLSMDWGSAKPFSVGWWAVSDGELPQFPRGALIRYREWYGMKPGQPNVGLKMPADQVGAGIAEMCGEFATVATGVADPAMFTEDGGPSLAERIYEGSGRKVVFRRADNRRVASKGAMGGWDQLRSRLSGDADGRPMIYFFSTCKDAIRTLPALQHDQNRPEDVDTDGEDHAPDEIRYACMSRPYIKDAPKSAPKPKYAQDMTFNDLWRLDEQWQN